jgi:hypothetical protein
MKTTQNSEVRSQKSECRASIFWLLASVFCLLPAARANWINVQTASYAQVRADCGDSPTGGTPGTIELNPSATSINLYLATPGSSNAPSGCKIIVTTGNSSPQNPATVCHNSGSNACDTSYTGFQPYGSSIVIWPMGVDDRTVFTSDGQYWHIEGSARKTLCMYTSTSASDILSADASGTTHYFGQTSSTQAQSSAKTVNALTCNLPAYFFTANTKIVLRMAGYINTSSSAPVVTGNFSVGSTSIGGNGPTPTSTSSAIETSAIYEMFSTASAGSNSGLVQVEGISYSGDITGGVVPSNFYFGPTSSQIPASSVNYQNALALSATLQWASAAAGNAIWYRDASYTLESY